MRNRVWHKLITHLISMEDIIRSSVKDSEIAKVRKGFYDNQLEDSIKNYKIFEDQLCFYEDILLRGNRIVIPNNLRKQVLVVVA